MFHRSISWSNLKTAAALVLVSRHATSVRSLGRASNSPTSQPLVGSKGRIRTMSTTTTTDADTNSDTIAERNYDSVNLMELATAATACIVAASAAIRQIASPPSTTTTTLTNEDGQDQRNVRLKPDGSFVTDADFAAQGIICEAIQLVNPHIKIIGEESPEEMAEHIGKYPAVSQEIMTRTRAELLMRYYQRGGETKTQNEGQKHGTPEGSGANEQQGLPLAPSAGPVIETNLEELPVPPDEWMVDASRVRVIIDPLDGTRSYSHGEYDAVSILIAIVVDNEPCFGVVGKPFGYGGVASMLSGECAAIYGGSLLKGVFVAGGKKLVAQPSTGKEGGELPRAVISSSRSEGLVHDFCMHLGKEGLVHEDPLLVSGAGEKSLRLILQQQNEALWFFPKAGTSIWDVAAPDALLRSLGGKLTDKYGQEMDYSKAREDAENLDGVIACIDSKLHEKCIECFKAGDWENR